MVVSATTEVEHQAEGGAQWLGANQPCPPANGRSSTLNQNKFFRSLGADQETTVIS